MTDPTTPALATSPLVGPAPAERRTPTTRVWRRRSRVARAPGEADPFASGPIALEPGAEASDAAPRPAAVQAALRAHVEAQRAAAERCAAELVALRQGVARLEARLERTDARIAGGALAAAPAPGEAQLDDVRDQLLDAVSRASSRTVAELSRLHEEALERAEQLAARGRVALLGAGGLCALAFALFVGVAGARPAAPPVEAAPPVLAPSDLAPPAAVPAPTPSKSAAPRITVTTVPAVFRRAPREDPAADAEAPAAE